jgi:hypothetical protein
MAETHPKRPRDLNQWAKRMVDVAIVDEQERPQLVEERQSGEPIKKRSERPHKPGRRGSD